ncbi:MAG: hypothetical protein J6R66_05320 [Clostridia bacterium]|nr:hypothetical protein [Clostridia bacterium]
MDENTKITNPEIENDDTIEYEEVKRLPFGAFVGIGLAFGAVAGFSVGNFLASQFFDNATEKGLLWGMTVCICAGLVGGIALGLINKAKSKKK